MEQAMTQARSILIRARGYTRVLRLSRDQLGVSLLRYRVRHRTPMCERCGCTERFGCEGGCGWVNAEQTLCSRCLEKGMLR